MKANQIQINLDRKVLVDFRCYAGGNFKATNLLKKWIIDYVNQYNKQDEELLESHRIMRENLPK
jgi:hypothetical protein